MTDSTSSPVQLIDANAQTIGRIINRRRTELGLSPIDLARRTGLARSYIYDIEADRTVYPATEKLAALLRSLSLSADDVLAEAGLLDRRRATTTCARSFPRLTPSAGSWAR